MAPARADWSSEELEELVELELLLPEEAGLVVAGLVVAGVVAVVAEPELDEPVLVVAPVELTVVEPWPVTAMQAVSATTAVALSVPAMRRARRAGWGRRRRDGVDRAGFVASMPRSWGSILRATSGVPR